MAEELQSETALIRFAKRHPIESLQTWSAALLLTAVAATLAASAAIVITREPIARTYADMNVALPSVTGFWLTAPEWLFYALAGAVVVGLVVKEVRLRNSIHAMGINASTAVAAMTLLAGYFYCLLIPLGTTIQVLK